MKLTQEKLKSLLHYDPVTGLFTWTQDRGGSVKRGAVAGSGHGHGYVAMIVDGERCLAHRLVFLYMTGNWPRRENQVDHINHIRSDNRWCNLREVSKLENAQNKTRRIPNSSGIQNIRWNKAVSKWAVEVNAYKRHYWLGNYDCLEFAKFVLNGFLVIHLPHRTVGETE